nr:transposase, Ptta/En/Spm, transposase, Tnp1/En/Spm-like protein [Tanacetum cinerariifolium]
MFPGLNMPLSLEDVCVVARKFSKALLTKSHPKDSKASKNKKEKYKSLAIKAKKVSSDEEVSYSDSDDEEYAMAASDFKKFFKRRGKFIRHPHEDKKNFQRAKEEKKGKKER